MAAFSPQPRLFGVRRLRQAAQQRERALQQFPEFGHTVGFYNSVRLHSKLATCHLMPLSVNRQLNPPIDVSEIT